MPNSREPCFKMPLAKLFKTTTTAKVMSATAQQRALPKFSAPEPPAMYRTAVGYRDRPMVKITVPVTTGGKSLRICLAKMPNTMATAPPMISAPRMVEKPNSPPMAVRVGT